jgi:uncharacterized protein (DUF302 family)
MNITFKVATDKTVTQAVADLKSALSSVSFGVLWELNFKDKMHEKGLQFHEDFHVLEVCNPHQAKRVLEENLEVGFFLPCKLAVYTQEGQTYIGMPKPTELMALMGNEALKSVAEEVESVLVQAIEGAR